MVKIKVTLDNTVLAVSDRTVVVENNHYFPPDDVNTALFRDSDTSSVCPWKGTASYYTIDVNGRIVDDVAWYYKSTEDKAKSIEGYIAFYKNKVEITEES